MTWQDPKKEEIVEDKYKPSKRKGKPRKMTISAEQSSENEGL